jgi:hypothetical protein
VSLTLIIECPVHIKYTGKISPSIPCRECRLIFAFRNNVHRVLSTPLEERTDSAELIVRGLAE